VGEWQRIQSLELQGNAGETPESRKEDGGTTSKLGHMSILLHLRRSIREFHQLLEKEAGLHSAVLEKEI
jgi:hypothetical protein